MHRGEAELSEAPQDPILDSCLEEILGGQHPPDLRSQILRAYREHSDRRAPSVSPADPQPPPVVVTAAVRGAAANRTRSRWSVGISTVIAAGIVLGGTLLGLVALRLSEPRPAGSTESAERPQERPPAEVGDPPALVVDQPQHDHIAPALAPNFGSPPADSVGAWDELAGRPDVTPLAFERIVGLIDERIRAGWREHGIQPASGLPDEEWCRQLYNRLLGRLPTERELGAFLGDPRRESLVRQLCLGSEFRQFARHWAGLWTDVLEVGREQREPLQAFIQQQLLAGGSLAELAAALLTGSRQSDPSGDPAAVHYRLAHRGPRTVALTAHSGRLFLGGKLRCAQCHDHPADSQLTQREFWETNAFFRSLARNRSASSADADAVFFETPEGEMKAAYPALFGLPWRSAEA